MYYVPKRAERLAIYAGLYSSKLETKEWQESNENIGQKFAEHSKQPTVCKQRQSLESGYTFVSRHRWKVCSLPVGKTFFVVTLKLKNAPNFLQPDTQLCYAVQCLVLIKREYAWKWNLCRHAMHNGVQNSLKTYWYL